MLSFGIGIGFSLVGFVRFRDGRVFRDYLFINIVEG